MAYGDKERKTLPPSAKKRREARKQGRVSKSPEITAWIVMLAVTIVIGPLFSFLKTQVFDVFGEVTHIASHPDQGQALAAFEHGLAVYARAALTVTGIFAIVAIIANVAQVGFVFASKAARPKFSRLNPISGLKNRFSLNSLWQGLRMFLKVAVVGYVAYRVLDGVAHTVTGAQPVTLEPVLAYIGQTVVQLVRVVTIFALALAALDYMFQRYRLRRSLMMTREEMKEEMRQMEGDPVNRRRIRAQQYKLSRLRMLAAISRADVVITNPTHVAVALKYERNAYLAPKVIAKGEGYLALSLKEEAFKVGVPVVEDPPLARAIHAACDVDDIIPRELYMAVAHLLAFVYSLTPDARLLGVAFRRPVSAMAL